MAKILSLVLALAISASALPSGPGLRAFFPLPDGLRRVFLETLEASTAMPEYEYKYTPPAVVAHRVDGKGLAEENWNFEEGHFDSFIVTPGAPAITAAPKAHKKRGPITIERESTVTELNEIILPTDTAATSILLALPTIIPGAVHDTSIVISNEGVLRKRYYGSHDPSNPPSAPISHQLHREHVNSFDVNEAYDVNIPLPAPPAVPREHQPHYEHIANFNVAPYGRDITPPGAGVADAEELEDLLESTEAEGEVLRVFGSVYPNRGGARYSHEFGPVTITAREGIEEEELDGFGEFEEFNSANRIVCVVSGGQNWGGPFRWLSLFKV
ncbi:hypothetical protein EDC01DRAFT_636561 [Geopyxis carbonaria]|nr:hypothetical protein EDC01DRAFT_636561 [Geopyxis carbonaria]